MKFCTVEKENNVLKINLNRPEIHNAFNDEMIVEMTEYFEQLKTDNETRVIVLGGLGKSFCAGADLNWMKKMKDYSEQENFDDSVALRGLFEAINSCPIPVIGRVHGAALGGGTGLMSVCDYVIAVEDTKIGFTEAKLGLLPAVISPFVVAKIGYSNARAYFLSGQVFNANVAKDIGLVHHVCSSDDLEAVVDKQVSRFLQAAPCAAKEAKVLAENLRKLPLNELGDYTCKTISRIRIGDEAQEGMSALLEKRKANWLES